MKLQELPESVPTGQMPCHQLVAVDRYLVGSVKPGTRVTVVGILATFEARGQEGGKGVKDKLIRHPYIRALGIQQDNEVTHPSLPPIIISCYPHIWGMVCDV
jgi:DNA replication licensing factor MCM5